MAQRHQILLGDISSFRQSRIQPRCIVSFGQNETIPILPVRPGGIDIHLLKVEISQNVRSRQGTARMAGFCGVHGS